MENVSHVELSILCVATGGESSGTTLSKTFKALSNNEAIAVSKKR